MRRTFWSLLVGATAVLPAVHGAREAKAAATPPAEASQANPSPLAVAEQTRRVDDRDLVRNLDQVEDAPGTSASTLPVALRARIRAIPRSSPRLPRAAAEIAPLARLALGLPQPRAPDRAL